MSEMPVRVVIAGGGVAGLETLMALHSIAGERVELALIAPNDEFAYRPRSADGQLIAGRARRVPVGDLARDARAAHFATTVEAVDPDEKTISTSDGARLEYDLLVLAVGAKATPAVPHAMTWDDRSDAELLGGLARDIDEGYTHSVAVVIPSGPAWPLRAYELALLIAREGYSMSATLETTIVSPVPSPLDLLGPRAVDAVKKELDAAGIEVVAADRVEVESGNAATLVLEPSGRRLEVDRILALPALEGRRVTGVPADALGFIDVDEHGRVQGLTGVWAVGDATAFPLKSMGFSAEQADVAAQDIAASIGAADRPSPFDPGGQERLAGLPSDCYLRAWLVDGTGQRSAGHLSLEMPVLTYLERDLAAGWLGEA